MNDRRPQTIQFFLPQGEPRGIRIAEITTRIVQAVLVPRSKLPEAANLCVLPRMPRATRRTVRLSQTALAQLTNPFASDP